MTMTTTELPPTPPPLTTTTDEALNLIDQFLTYVIHREYVTVDEATNFGLDLRRLLTIKDD